MRFRRQPKVLTATEGDVIHRTREDHASPLLTGQVRPPLSRADCSYRCPMRTFNSVTDSKTAHHGQKERIYSPVRCEFAFTRAAGSETARDNGFATYSSPAPRESVVDFPRGMSA